MWCLFTSLWYGMHNTLKHNDAASAELVSSWIFNTVDGVAKQKELEICDEESAAGNLQL